MSDPSVRRYRYTNLADIHHGVVVAQPDGEGPATVYVPPVGDELPYERKFMSLAEAEQFAKLALHHVPGSDTYVVTRDRLDWWRINLIPAEEAGSS